MSFHTFTHALLSWCFFFHIYFSQLNYTSSLRLSQCPSVSLCSYTTVYCVSRTNHCISYCINHNIAVASWKAGCFHSQSPAWSFRHKEALKRLLNMCQKETRETFHKTVKLPLGCRGLLPFYTPTKILFSSWSWTLCPSTSDFLVFCQGQLIPLICKI